MAKPIRLIIAGDNWFHQGWIEGVLGTPKREFMDVNNPVLDTDIDAYDEGYQMAQDTSCSIPMMREAIAKAIELRQLVVY